jgi:hypothetical protein
LVYLQMDSGAGPFDCDEMFWKLFKAIEQIKNI